MSTVKKVLENSTKIISITAIALVVFAAWFAINFAKSKTKKEFDARQTYFNDVHQHFHKDWAKNAYWDSLKAESFQYSNGETLLNIRFQKQVFNDQFNVPTINTERPDLYDVIQMQLRVQKEDTQSAATLDFLRMNTLVLHKASIANVNPQSISHKAYSNTQGIISVAYNSALDYEGIGQKVLVKDVFLQEQLPYVLRSIVSSDTSRFKVNILEPQTIDGAGKFTFSLAELQVIDSTATDYTVALRMNKEEFLYRFESRYPNRPLSIWVNKQKFELKR